MTLFNWLLLAFLSFLWGGSFFFNEIALTGFPIFTVVFGRVFIAAILLILILYWKKVSIPWSWPLVLSFLAMGLINNVIPFSLIVAGQTEITSSLTSVLNATTPLFAALVAHFATTEASERLNLKRIVGIGLGIIGVAILLGPKIGEIGFSGNEVLGQLAILGSSFSYGIAVVFGRRFGRMGISPLATAAGQVTASSLWLFPIILIVDRPWTYLVSSGWEAISAIICIAVFSTALAYILYFRLIQTAGSTNASLVTLLIPVTAMLLGFLFLDETITSTMLIGLCAIASGLLVIDGRVFKFLKRKSPA
ncbi:DMT family transporter [Sneathiella limimaris]|uniref:DMT family transporter n=1 Tax=Sneathiella limimaris TaxID=1964213 RepID=UPI00146F1DBA|nr:DMT family transporter [Sneathiella limimaris]